MLSSPSSGHSERTTRSWRNGCRGWKLRRSADSAAHATPQPERRLRMRKLIRPLLLAAVTVLAAAPLAAQSDILLRLRSGSPLGDRFRVDSAGGVVAIGELGIGIIPASGSGERLMWYPFKAAFRAGGIGAGGTMWDDANLGFYTWAGGFNTTATGL